MLRRFGIARSDALRSVQLVTPEHRRYSGADAVFRALEYAPELRSVMRIARFPCCVTSRTSCIDGSQPTARSQLASIVWLFATQSAFESP